jgi:TRAF3-interacting protein 1
MAEPSNPWTADTIKVLEPLIKKPKLTEALLGKPPFAYIQAIVQNIVEATSYPPNVFSAEDFVVSKEHPKEFKMSFLTKLVDFLNTTGTPSPAKAAKILAGLEPENTNKLLQVLGNLAAQSKGSSATEKPKKPREKKASGEEKTAEKKSSKSEKPKEEKKSEKPKAEKKGTEKTTEKKSSTSASPSAPKKETKTKTEKKSVCLNRLPPTHKIGSFCSQKKQQNKGGRWS